MDEGRSLKIVHLIASDTGGAYRAADRISRALTLCGADSTVTVLEKKRQDSRTNPYFRNLPQLLLFKAVRKLHAVRLVKWGLAGRVYRSDLGININRLPGIKEADIIHLHWINDGMLSYRGLAQLCAGSKPVVWTMHDMFSFTAGCYYDELCGGYENGCRCCPFGGHGPGQAYFDEMYAQKALAYRGNIGFVGCSSWIADCAARSTLCAQSPVVRIPNPIDLDVFHPMEKDAAYARLGLPRDGKKLILFGATLATTDKRKGYPLLLEALRSLPDKHQYRLAVFGGAPDYKIDVPMEVLNLGTIHSDELLCAMYAAADVFVAPSLQENLSNAVMEALSCGTPVAAFDIGGMGDMIAHGSTGYLAAAYDPADLARGIARCAGSDFRDACRASVEQRFSMEIVGKAYLEFYQKMLEA